MIKLSHMDIIAVNDGSVVKSLLGMLQHVVLEGVAARTLQTSEVLYNLNKDHRHKQTHQQDHYRVQNYLQRLLYRLSRIKITSLLSIDSL